jgi:hypothetical protein
MAALKEKGVRFSPKISEDGPVRIAHFSDEDGNPLYLVEQKSSQTAQGWTKTQ